MPVWLAKGKRLMHSKRCGHGVHKLVRVGDILQIPDSPSEL